MENLEKNLSNLPKPKLSWQADFKIRFKIYSFIFVKNLKKPFALLLIKNTLVARVALTALVVIIVLGSTAVYAASNDQLTLGDTFYPLKKVIENVEKQLTISETAKVDTLGKFSERRLKEALNLAQEELENDEADEDTMVSDNNIEQSIDEALDNVDSAMKTRQKMENINSAEKAKDSIKKKNESIIQYLEDIGDIAEKNQDEEMFDKVNKAREAINKYNKILAEDESFDDLPINTDNSVIENQRDRESDRQNNDDEENDSDNNSQNNFNESEQNSRQDRENND